MRMILGATDPSTPILPSLWMLITTSQAFITLPYLTDGYDTLDAHLVGGGGGGGGGGNGYITVIDDPDTSSVERGGGGGGGGGAGMYRRSIGISLASIPASSPVSIGLAGVGGAVHGMGSRGGNTTFNGLTAFGGGAGGGGCSSNGVESVTAYTPHGGSGGQGGGLTAAGANGLTAVTPQNSTDPKVVITPNVTGGGGNGGTGGNGGGYNNRPFYYPGHNGGAGIQAASGDGSGGGGGGGAVGFWGVGQTSKYFDIVKSGKGGAGVYGALGGINDVDMFAHAVSNSKNWFSGGNGGGGGASVNLTDLLGYMGLDGNGAGSFSYPGDSPGAGGAGGHGGTNYTGSGVATKGSSGADGCLLLHIYKQRVNSPL